MECKKCACRHVHVVWTRPRGKSVVRLRRCRACGHEMRTVEAVSQEKLTGVTHV